MEERKIVRISLLVKEQERMVVVLWNAAGKSGP
jgi:hypothetical protein